MEITLAEAVDIHEAIVAIIDAPGLLSLPGFRLASRRRAIKDDVKEFFNRKAEIRKRHFGEDVKIDESDPRYEAAAKELKELASEKINPNILPMMISEIGNVSGVGRAISILSDHGILVEE